MGSFISYGLSFEGASCTSRQHCGTGVLSPSFTTEVTRSFLQLQVLWILQYGLYVPGFLQGLYRSLIPPEFIRGEAMAVQCTKQSSKRGNSLLSKIHEAHNILLQLHSVQPSLSPCCYFSQGLSFCSSRRNSSQQRKNNPIFKSCFASTVSAKSMPAIVQYLQVSLALLKAVLKVQRSTKAVFLS